MSWHENEYEDFRLLIADYEINAAALVYEKETKKWLCGFVSDIRQHTMKNFTMNIHGNLNLENGKKKFF